MRNQVGLLAAAVVLLPGAAFAGHSLRTVARPSTTVSVERGVTVVRAQPHVWQNNAVSVNTNAETPVRVRIVHIVRADYLAADTRPRGDRIGRFRFNRNF